MPWIVKWNNSARKKLLRIPIKDQNRILDYFIDRVISHTEPRSLAKPLVGQNSPKWRFRVGDNRIITVIEEKSSQ